eukprot:Sdes_comp19435_c0_seq1m10821
MFFYLIWQISFVVKTEWIDKKKLSLDLDLQTSYRWLVNKTPSHPINSILNRFPPKLKLLAFILTQMVYTALATYPTKYFYQHQWIHTLVFAFVFFVCIWNGGSFYVVFLNKKAGKIPQGSETSSKDD